MRMDDMSFMPMPRVNEAPVVEACGTYNLRVFARSCDSYRVLISGGWGSQNRLLRVGVWGYSPA